MNHMSLFDTGIAKQLYGTFLGLCSTIKYQIIYCLSVVSSYNVERNMKPVYFDPWCMASAHEGSA